ncbi:hypothetical protein K788_0004480 [Paraburkholderia caribensis MBA4]|uniref:Uncharacterized protein n=1 Tax=Paraburkholderia caribensis MBA4 TaxID=1323664 RepID=A0A0P0RAB8_9BURK|nr:hypothetical protein K788_0004480 [Paraburkholderia caribensis MBA4]
MIDTRAASTDTAAEKKLSKGRTNGAKRGENSHNPAKVTE